MGSTTEALAREPGFTPALPHERCNFHPNVPAVLSYVGTPLCEQCMRRLQRNAS